MPSAAAKSGPSGITMTKSRTLTNWIAPIKNTIELSEREVAAGVPGKGCAGGGDWDEERLIGASS
jgi:hypothetical protein